MLRVGLGIAFIYPGISSLLGAPGSGASIFRSLIDVSGGILLLAGYWTPVAGALVAVDQIWLGFFSQPESLWNHIFLALLAAGVAMVGPGAWSIDARLFGRKRFRMDVRTPGKRPPL